MKIGYIVVNFWGPCQLCRRSASNPGYPKGGILLKGFKKATVFPTRRAARDAIKRTQSYGEKHNLNWMSHKDTIFGVELSLFEKQKKKGAKRG